MAHLNELDNETKFLHSKIVEIMHSRGIDIREESIIENCCKAIAKLEKSSKTRKISLLLKLIIAHREHVRLNGDILGILDVSIRQEPELMLSILKCCLANSEFKNIDEIQHALEKYAEEPKVKLFMRKHIEKRLGRDKKESIDELERRIDIMIAEMAPSNAEVLEFLRQNKGLPARIIEKIPFAVSTDQGGLMEILEAYYALAKHSTTVSTRVVELTAHVVLEEEHYDDEIARFVSSFSHLLLPSFTKLVESMNAAFLEKKKYASALRNIIGCMGIESFIDLVSPVEMSRHAAIFRNVSNTDLSVFVRLYKRYACENSSNELSHLLECLPGFCSYCTDYDGVIGEVLMICKSSIRDSRGAVCRALEKLIYTQRQNLAENLVLPNEIPREHTARILAEIRDSGIVNAVLGAFLCDSGVQCDSVLELLVDLTGIDMSSELESIILKRAVNSGISGSDAVRLMPFFVRKWSYNYDLIAELMSQCSSSEASVQKRAYTLLTAIYKEKDVPCVCDVLFASTERLLQAPAARHRILLMYTIAKKGCPCAADIKNRFFQCVSKYASEGNAKCKKMVKEIICEVIENRELYEFILSNIDPEAEDVHALTGYVLLLQIVVDCMERYGAAESIVSGLFERIKRVCFVSETIVRPAICIFGRMLRMECFAPFVDEIASILSQYMRTYSKKYNRELKDVAMIAKSAGCELTKEMRTMLRLKNRGGSCKKIEVTKAT